MDKKLNICLFSGDITRSGGTERVASIIANELTKQYNVSFVSLTERKKVTFFEINSAISRYVLYKKEVKGKLHFCGYVNRLRKIVNEHNIDILIDIDGIIDMYSIPVKWLTGVKVISWEHFNLYHHPSLKLRNAVRSFAVKHLDGIVTLTEQDKEYYQQKYTIKCPIMAIHNPVMKTGIKSNYNIDSKVIMSVGRLTYQKGFDRLVNVAEIVLKDNENWKWLIFGEGEDYSQLQDEINRRNLQDKLLLMGNVDNIDYRYGKAAMFVMTSRYEGLPMTLLEAKHYHLPIVSFDIKTGPRECILDNVNGYLVKDNDIETMAKQINSLIKDNKKRLDFSNRSLEDTEKFDITYIMDKWKSLINEVL